MSARHQRGEAQRLIAQLFSLFGPGCELICAREREWASATFAGTRHQFELHVPDHAGLGAALLALPEHEFDLPDAIVADASASASAAARAVDPDGQYRRIVTVELLTVVAD